MLQQELLKYKSIKIVLTENVIDIFECLLYRLLPFYNVKNMFQKITVSMYQEGGRFSLHVETQMTTDFPT